MKAGYFLSLQYEDYRVIAQIAYAVEENDFTRFDILVIHLNYGSNSKHY